MHRVVRVKDLSDLVAAVPSLLGFYPTDSLIVVVLTGPDRNHVAMTLRLDLPPAGQRRSVVTQLLGFLRQHDDAAVLLLVVGGHDEPEPASESPPQRGLVRIVNEGMSRLALPVAHRLWASTIATGVRWQCYDDSSCSGILPAPDPTAIAAETVAAGRITYGSRSELASLLTPDDETTLALRAERIEQLLAAAPPADRSRPDEATSRALRQLFGAIDAMRRGTFKPSNANIARLAVALTGYEARDACVMAPTNERAAAAEQLWLTLTKAVPAPYRAEPASLLAMSAYLRGDGAFSAIALDAAQDADPDHRLSGLLRDALNVGLPASHLDALVAGFAQAAARLLSAPDGLTDH
ncbi:DUF4192 domain-containing protein [Saccharothrix sp. NPDC042600]|uniref:DUF4192 domain-containing protein n=1 Tax=Saccharothrix TaxID=2071 RepID=UPI0033E2C9EA|nr:DUF4192 domain-containing protein [Saccharothrix mutabilis subsp. capreolus]